MFDPAIKWSGSKRSQAAEILKFFPTEIGTYYEPFCGGASVFRALVEEGISVKSYVLSDINEDLISLWKAIKTDPTGVGLHYEKFWNELNRDDDLERKKAYFAEIRQRFNRYRDPKDFMCIMRTTTNGMPRYNIRNEFNNSFHITRNGIHPSRLHAIIYEWSRILNENDVILLNCSYTDINPCRNDFLYLDPPYANTKGMYYGSIDQEELWKYLQKLPCPYALSFDGISGDKDNTQDIPIDAEHHYIRSGNSSFKRIIGKDRNAIVWESLYVKR